MAEFTLIVNGERVVLDQPGTLPLLDALRTDLGLCGTRVGCTEGHCGACTVLLDGQPLQSCQTPLEAAAGHAVETIEAPHFDAVRDAFLAEQAAQCGYCTNGIIVTIAGLLARRPRPTRAAIVAALDERHICRCGAQARILRVLDRLMAEPQ
jgi:aerobic-type carbon monoxide dehydrogenase small subunit (CoxS/CutS family)